MATGTSPCVPCCSATTQTVNVPGASGADGSNGTNGVNAYTTYVGPGPDTVPAIGATVTVNVASSAWMAVGQNVIVAFTAGGVGNFVVTAKPTAQQATLQFLSYPGDVAVGTAFVAGGVISPAGIRGPGLMYYVAKAAAFDMSGAGFFVGNIEVIEMTADGFTVTLPSAATYKGKWFTVKQTAAKIAGTIIAASGGQTIDGVASKTIGATNGFFTVLSNGANWIVISLG